MKSRPYVMPAERKPVSIKKVVGWILVAPLAMLVLMIVITLGVGFAQAIGSNHSPNQITIEKTDSMYDDCVTFAQARGFDASVCKGIQGQVSGFNDGFATSKQDDCSQGDDKACEWLATTR